MSLRSLCCGPYQIDNASMPRLYVGNFDFEHDLASGPRELPRAVRSLAADLVSAWIAVSEPEDVIWSPTGAPAYDFHDLKNLGMTPPRWVSREDDLPRGADWELVPWGWTSQWVAFGRAHGWSCPAPPLDIVRQVNSRIFRCELEQELGIAPSGSAVLRSMAELLAHVAQQVTDDAGWVLKANFGMAGRERVVGRGPRVGEPALNWARRRLVQSDTGLVFEPWLERAAEAGLQWDIPASGEPRLLGITPLLTDAGGTYRGSRIVCSDVELSDWQPAVEVTLQVARRLQQLGYWGPLGIDAMRYRTASGEILCRPLQDLNARFTMGRLALGLRRFVPTGCSAEWLHDADLVALAVALNPAVSVMQTTARSWLLTT